MSSPIRFYLDEHVATAIAAGLRRRGIDVTAPHEVGLLGADDLVHLQFAQSQGHVVITHERDFTRHHVQAAAHAGIVYCHQDKHGIGDLLAALVVLHGVMTAEEMVGTLEFL